MFTTNFYGNLGGNEKNAYSWSGTPVSTSYPWPQSQTGCIAEFTKM